MSRRLDEAQASGKEHPSQGSLVAGLVEPDAVQAQQGTSSNSTQRDVDPTPISRSRSRPHPRLPFGKEGGSASQ